MVQRVYLLVCEFDNSDAVTGSNKFVALYLCTVPTKFTRMLFFMKTVVWFIKGFDLKYCDLNTMLVYVAVLLRTLTLNVDPRHRQPIPLSAYILTTIGAVCSFYIYIFSMAWFVFWRSWEKKDVTSVVVVLSLGISCAIGPCRLFNMFIHKKELQRIVESIRICDSFAVPGSRFERNLVGHLRKVKMRAIGVWAATMGNGVIYIVTPLLLPGRHFMEDLYVIYGLEPMTETPNYQIAFTIFAIAIIFINHITVTTLILLIIITGNTEAQMIALSHEMINIRNDAQQYYKANKSKPYRDSKNKMINNFIQNKFSEMIKIHTANIDVIRQTDRLFRSSIALEFTLLYIALIADLLGGLENTHQEVFFSLVQMGMNSLIGQMLINSNEQFLDAVYSCDWEKFDVKSRKTVLLVMMNSQKTMRLSAGGMSVLCSAGFMTVVRSVYSAYTALRTIVK